MCELFSRLNGNINWSNLWNGVDGQVSYIQSLIMYLGEIFLYLIFSFFINTYKDSGLSFFLFLKSIFINDVSRNIEAAEQEDSLLKNIEHHQELSAVNKGKNN